MGRLVNAVAVSAAALCAQGLGVGGLGAARAEEANAPRAAVQGELEPALRVAIEQAVGETDRPIENRFEARRRARAAAEDAIAVLRSEGYYAYQVAPDVSGTEPPAPLVRVEPGARFVIADPKIEWQGSQPEPATTAAAQAAMALAPGQPGRAAEVVGAEGRIVAAVQKWGYADVTAEPREVVVDHADHSVRPTFRIAAGGLVRLDGLDFSTDGRTRLAWLQTLAPWAPGDRYDPADVAELERRLLDTGVYESVTVGLAPPDKATAEGLRPVLVSLAERKARTLELSASYATTDGAGVEARWTRYNLLRRADTLSVLARVSDRDTRIGPEVSLPHWRRPQQTLRLAGAGYRIRTDAYDETGGGVQADVTRRYSRTSWVTVGASLDLSRTEELVGNGVLTPLGRDIITFAGLADVALDRSDDPLDPTRGWRVSGRLEPTLLAGDETLPYLRLQAQGSIYYALGKLDKTVVAGRLRIGSIANGSIPEIPASRRFYAGGGGSVRGFGYQDVGPRLSDGTPMGGLSLVEASVEVRRDVTGPWGVVLFVDAGAVGSGRIPNDDLSVGAGVGLRYNLAFGPIRVDVATPVTDRASNAAYQVYVSIGQAF